MWSHTEMCEPVFLESGLRHFLIWRIFYNPWKVLLYALPMFIVMLDETCLSTKFLLTNPTGHAFNLAWIFLKTTHKISCHQDLQLTPKDLFSVLSTDHVASVLTEKSWLLHVSSCLLQFDDWLKDFLQCLHVYGFSPVWVRSCCLKVDESLKDFRQCLHVCGFSPVWVLSCRLQLDDWLKGFLQCLHVYGFFPVWVRSCRLQSDDQLKDFLQYLHVYDFIPVWAFCSMQSVTWLKIQPQCCH